MRSEFIDANGIRFHYLTDGQGPLVVLLHGFPQLSYQYRHLVHALARAGYRAVAPDMRGFGDTTRPARISDYALQTLGEDVAALIDALGESKAHVLGHEWGAIVAAEAALSYPDKIDRLILVNGSPEITLGRGIHHCQGAAARGRSPWDERSITAGASELGARTSCSTGYHSCRSDGSRPSMAAPCACCCRMRH